jgi:hypothetical protein
MNEEKKDYMKVEELGKKDLLLIFNDLYDFIENDNFYEVEMIIRDLEMRGVERGYYNFLKEREEKYGEEKKMNEENREEKKMNEENRLKRVDDYMERIKEEKKMNEDGIDGIDELDMVIDGMREREEEIREEMRVETEREMEFFIENFIGEDVMDLIYIVDKIVEREKKNKYELVKEMINFLEEKYGEVN